MELLRIIKNQERDSLLGIMGSFIQGNGLMVKDMELVYGLLLKEILIWENGLMELFKVKGFIKQKEDKGLREPLEIS